MFRHEWRWQIGSKVAVAWVVISITERLGTGDMLSSSVLKVHLLHSICFSVIFVLGV